MRDRFHVDGEWVEPAGTVGAVVNPAPEGVVAGVPEATPADADGAVAASPKAVDGWSATPVEERTALREGCPTA